MKKTRMFLGIVKDKFPTSFKVDAIDKYILWHMRYGHLRFRGLNLLYKKQMVRWIPLIEQPNKIS
jgi:hypothetical protein